MKKQYVFWAIISYGVFTVTQLFPDYDWETKNYSAPTRSINATQRKEAQQTEEALSTMVSTNSSLAIAVSAKTTSPKIDKDSFSACLLTMDDNHRLVEWLGYHYHVLPLRHLIVAVDPRSSTSPTNIFNIWRQYGIVIEEWSDEDFLPEKQQTYGRQNKSKAEKEWLQLSVNQRKEHHRLRQTMFMAKCARQMKTLGKSWVLFIDSDEYLRYNTQYAATAKSEGDNNMTDATTKTTAKDNNKRQQLPAAFPSLYQSSTMMNYIKTEMKRNGTIYDSPCLSFSRLLYGIVEMKNNHSAANVITKKKINGTNSLPLASLMNMTTDSMIINRTVFDSQRYRFHLPPHHQENGIGKVMLDVSRIPMTDLPKPI